MIALAGCGEEADRVSATSAGEPPREVSSTQDAVDAAVDWIEADITIARTEVENGLSTESGVALGLFVYTYADDGQVGRLESTQELREPIIPFPVVWQGDTYFLDTQNFSIDGTTGPGISAGTQDVAAGLDSPEEDWRRTAAYLGTAFAFLRAQDPLRLLQAFVPDQVDLPPEENGRMSIAGQAKRDELMGADAYRDAIKESLNADGSEGGPSLDQLIPAEVRLVLTVVTDDWRPLELRIETPPGPDARQIVVRWERGSEAPAIPQGYTPLLDFIRPAADAGELLETAEKWLEEQPTSITYDGGAMHLDVSSSKSPTSPVREPGEEPLPTSPRPVFS
jgi:hypothetical protein